jgi:hypothetical protein
MISFIHVQEKPQFLKEIRLDRVEILPIYCSESQKRGTILIDSNSSVIGFRIAECQSDFRGSARQQHERASMMYQFNLHDDSNQTLAAEFIFKVRLAQKANDFEDLRVLRPQNHSGNIVNLAPRTVGAKFIPASRILLLLLNGNTVKDIFAEVQTYIQQDNMAMSWPYCISQLVLIVRFHRFYSLPRKSKG